MSITQSTIEYVRNPSVPEDYEGRIQYVIAELDKISFTLVNMQHELNQALVSLDERLTVLEP